MSRKPDCPCGVCEQCRKKQKWEAPMLWPASYHSLYLRSAYRQYYGEISRVSKVQRKHSNERN